MENIKTNFKNASEAFDYFNQKIRTDGVEFAGTKALFNVGFTLEYPKNISIGITGILVILESNGDENIINDKVIIMAISLLIYYIPKLFITSIGYCKT